MRGMMWMCAAGMAMGAWAAELPPLVGDGVADDTAAIQARLDAGSPCVYLPPPKKHYLISRTLKIGSDTELRLDRYSVIRLAPKSNCPMIENKGYLQGQEKRIALTGGIWDMANVDQSPNPQQYGTLGLKSPMPKCHENDFFFGMSMRFCHVTDMTVKGLTFRNPTSYGIEFCHADYVLVDDISFDYVACNPIFLNMDGVHLDGFCHHFKISNLRGTCYDDLVALNANDGQCAPEEGPIHDITIDGVYADYCHSAVRLLSTGAPLERVTIRNVHGNFYTYAVGLTHFFPQRGRGWMNDIVISDIFAAKVFSPDNIGRTSRVGYPLVFVQKLLDVGNLTIRNLVRDERNISIPSIRVEKNASVRHLTVRDCRHTNHLDKPVTFYENLGRVDKACFENNDVSEAPAAK